MDYRLLFIAVLLLLPSFHKREDEKLCAAPYELQSTMPKVAFRSTSVYADQRNQDTHLSILKVDGSVNAEAYMAGAPRKAPGGGPGSSPGTPGGNLDPGTQQPLGDAVIPLLVWALVYFALLKGQRKGKNSFSFADAVIPAPTARRR